MPTEQEILAAGPLSPDDPQVQAALKRISRGMQHVVMRLVEGARRTAAEQPPEDPPPDEKERGGPRTTEGRPTASSNTDAPHRTNSRRPLCMPPS